jgi:hypothetical protein
MSADESPASARGTLTDETDVETLDEGNRGKARLPMKVLCESNGIN